MTTKEWREKNPAKVKEYNKMYAQELRYKARKPIEVEKNGYKYILLRAKIARLETKIHRAPCYMGYKDYVLHKVKKIIR